MSRYGAFWIRRSGDNSDYGTQTQDSAFTDCPRYGVDLVDHQPILLGRDTIPNLPNTVSGCQLELTPFEGKLLLRHLDSNSTLIQKDATWYSLNEYWMPISDLAASSVTLALADVYTGIELK